MGFSTLLSSYGWKTHCASSSYGSEFHNYKYFFGIVLFALIDAEYNFLYANIGCQGRISDGGVLRDSGLFKKLENNSLNLPAHSTLPGKNKKITLCILRG